MFSKLFTLTISKKSKVCVRSICIFVIFFCKFLLYSPIHIWNRYLSTFSPRNRLTFSLNTPRYWIKLIPVSNLPYVHAISNAYRSEHIMYIGPFGDHMHSIAKSLVLNSYHDTYTIFGKVRKKEEKKYIVCNLTFAHVVLFITNKTS